MLIGSILAPSMEIAPREHRCRFTDNGLAFSLSLLGPIEEPNMRYI